MEINNEIKRIKMISLFFIIIILMSLALLFYSIYMPYFTITGHNASLYSYTLRIFQEMPFVVIALLIICLIQIPLLFTFFGIFQLKEKARRALVFISVGGIIIYVGFFVYSKIAGQKLPPPVKECLILCALLYSFTRQKIKEQFK